MSEPSEPNGSGGFVLLGADPPLPLSVVLLHRSGGLESADMAASFHRRPVARWVGAAKPLARFLLSRPPPAWAARLFLAGRDAPTGLVSELRSVVADVAPNVLAARVRSALTVDATAALAACPVPLLFLGGSRDRVLRRSVVREMLRVQPSMRHRLLEAPHLVLQRQPLASGMAIRGFLCELGRSAVP